MGNMKSTAFAISRWQSRNGWVMLWFVQCLWLDHTCYLSKYLDYKTQAWKIQRQPYISEDGYTSLEDQLKENISIILSHALTLATLWEVTFLIWSLVKYRISMSSSFLHIWKWIIIFLDDISLWMKLTWDFASFWVQGNKYIFSRGHGRYNVGEGIWTSCNSTFSDIQIWLGKFKKLRKLRWRKKYVTTLKGTPRRLNLYKRPSGPWKARRMM